MQRSEAIGQVLGRLAETRPRIEVATGGLPPGKLHTRPAPDQWSANDVLAHLRACADVWGGCIARILAEDRPTFRAVSPRRWIERTDYPDVGFGPSLHAFGSQRDDLLAVLEGLPPDAWARAATVTGAGRPTERTVLSYAERMARHEREHAKQIERIADSLR